MSLRDQLFRSGNAGSIGRGGTLPTRRLLDAKNLTDYSIQTYGHGEIVYFIVKPINVAVLSQSAINAKVNSLMNLLKGIDEMEILCLNSRESFESNKAALKERLLTEMNESVRRLLEKDLLFLDQIQIQTASAREFLIGLRFTKEADILPSISRIEKLLKEQGFFARLAIKDDLKRIFAVYFTQNMTQVISDDYDGERWFEGK